MPLLFVRTRTMRLVRFASAVKRPLAPFAGAAKVTVAPATGLPFLSVTVTASGIGKRPATVVDWPFGGAGGDAARCGGEVLEGVPARLRAGGGGGRREGAGGLVRDERWRRREPVRVGERGCLARASEEVGGGAVVGGGDRERDGRAFDRLSAGVEQARLQRRSIATVDGGRCGRASRSAGAPSSWRGCRACRSRRSRRRRWRRSR